MANHLPLSPKHRKYTLDYIPAHKPVKNKDLHQAGQLMSLVREMIDMAYVYEGDTDTFYRKFLEKISRESLKERGIIEPESLLLTPKYNRMCSELRGDDAELWALLQAGFTTRELKMIYGHTNINSMYVKINRLKGRLSRKMQELMENRNL